MSGRIVKYAWIIVAFGAGLLITNLTSPYVALKWWFIGLFCVLLGLFSLILVFVRQRARERYAALVFERRPRVVVIGGGTGQPVLLRGLKNQGAEITAIVTVGDDGGSSGRLRTEFDMPPPGDIRNCLVALADTEPLLEELLQHRFKEGSVLTGHSFGNLFLAAMTSITGDFETAVKETSRVLAVRGRVLPAATQEITLFATYTDGTTEVGESAIPKQGKSIERIDIAPPDVLALPDALAAIREADAIVIGPGSLFTSVLPNLLVPGIADAVRESHGKVMYVCNVMTQPGETDGFTASQHVEAVYRHVGPRFFDMIIVNSASIPAEMSDQYGIRGAHAVTADVEKLHALGLTVIARNFLHNASYVRHDPDLIAQQVLALIGREHRR
ncbi:gluconeogenesis factor YvcK family protein [Ferroacidibacillus organovorans]|uniref:Gluconeogenesis factor n=1 Tax=Ferroacidibacillus organovorans TaxID=1765683 RepID=A0A162SVC6_9BACL|nr:YvcK family protein [Ferroacidibacillus organovorans]KYP80187.1 hypothetical protein AYJ22_02825 [Ferroacidibacillus organovorans]OAG95063.1 hypothetical protein AYW79_02300 [Ferroacidibacillus organovorans]OPG17616.1 YvcK family protein [Ferroacidibacillus organovorans]